MLRLNMVYYGPHGAEDNAVIKKVRPEYLIDNPPHGLWGEMTGYDNPNLLHDVNPMQQAGIKVIGYITGGYEATGSGSGLDKRWYTLEMNEKLIKNMKEIDGVKGVFIDECSAYPGKQSRKYLREITDYAHRLGLVTWGNVGADDFDEWFFTDGGFDMMNASETWHGQELSWVQDKWAGRISVVGINSFYNSKDAIQLTKVAWNKGLAYCYITDKDYTSLPSWIEEYASLLIGVK